MTTSASKVLGELLTASVANDQLTFRQMVKIAALDVATDFVGASLRNLDFRGEDLSGFNFTEADLAGSDFRDAIITGMKFEGANLDGVIGLEPHQAKELEPLFDLREAKRMIVNGISPPAAWGPAIKKMRLGNSGIGALNGLKGLLWLRELSLKSTRVDDLGILGGLLSLRSLSLDNNLLEDLSCISPLVELRSLSLSACAKVSDLQPLSSLKKLEHLDISYTGVRDISPIAGLKQMRSISCSAARLTDIRSLSELHNLRWIIASAAKSQNLNFLSNLKNLYRLTLGEVDDISFIEQMDYLNQIIIQSNEARTIPMLPQNLVDASFLVPLVDKIIGFKAPKKIRSLTIQSKISNFDALVELRNIKELNLTNTSDYKTPDVDFSILSNLVNLTELRLIGQPIKDLSHFASLKDLRFLDLEGTLVRDLSPLYSFPSLNYVDLYQSQVTAEDVDKLKEACPHIHVRWPTEWHFKHQLVVR